MAKSLYLPGTTLIERGLRAGRVETVHFRNAGSYKGLAAQRQGLAAISGYFRLWAVGCRPPAEMPIYPVKPIISQHIIDVFSQQTKSDRPPGKAFSA
ncbi:MAG: hypothetical protein BGN84_06615 [Afipia sp. 62-7]|nr:MAG: hypothetical protein BGN84_06615 [Afipia sp. 62-7]